MKKLLLIIILLASGICSADTYTTLDALPAANSINTDTSLLYLRDADNTNHKVSVNAILSSTGITNESTLFKISKNILLKPTRTIAYNSDYALQAFGDQGSVWCLPDEAASMQVAYGLYPASGGVYRYSKTGIAPTILQVGADYFNVVILQDGTQDEEASYTGVTPIHAEAAKVDVTTLNVSSRLRLEGNAMCWVDVASQGFASIKDQGTGSLALTIITGNVQGYAMSVGDTVPFSVEMDHGWVTGSITSQHLHIRNMTNVNAARYIKFQWEFITTDVNGDMSAPITVSVNYQIPANTKVGTMRYVELLNSILPLSGVSGQVTGTCTRVVATGTAPANDPIVAEYGIHGLVNKLGSSREYAE